MNKVKNALFYIVSFLGCIIMILRCLNNDFWADEAYTINAVNNLSYKDMFSWDPSSPPLYFVILKLLSHIGGNTFFTYHFVSCIPLLLLVLFTAKVIYKQVDPYVATIFVAFLCFQPESTTYFTEVRPYAWSALFVFLCFWEGYQLLKDKGNTSRKWILFNVWGILAAYSHYWAFGEVIVLYISFFTVLIIWDKKNIRKCIISILVSLLIYVPGLLCFVKSMLKMSGSFWIKEPVSLKYFLAFFINDKKLPCIIISIAITILLFIMSFRRDWKRNLFWSQGNCCEVLVLLIALFEIICVFLVEVAYGTLVSPLFVTRYLFPIGPIIWFSIAELFLFLDNGKVKNASFIVFFVLLIGIYGTRYYSTITKEIEDDQITRNSIEVINNLINNENTVLVTDIEHLEYGVLQYYFPQNECILLSEFEENGVDNAVFLLEDTGDKIINDYFTSIIRDVKWKYCCEGKISRYSYQLFWFTFGSS